MLFGEKQPPMQYNTMDQIKAIHIKFKLAFATSQVVLHTIIILKHTFTVKETFSM